MDPDVFQAMLQEMQMGAANPSSVHEMGRKARARLIAARDQIAAFFKVSPTEVLFTSGATEGMNALLQGMDLKGKHVISSAAEHALVINCLNRLDSTFLPPGLWGAVTVEQVRAALKPNTALIVLMAVNNETGVKTDIEGIASLAAEKGIPFFVDGVALIGKEAFSFVEGISAMVFSAHKFHGPKGVGFTLLRKGLKLKPFLVGGMQEYEKRAGTENLPGIMGLAAAIKKLEQVQQYQSQMQLLRDTFEKRVLELFPNASINGLGPRICNTSNICFTGIDGESLLMQLDLEGVMASHGSACSSGALQPSRVLLNMGLSRDQVRSSLRFSFSRFNTLFEIEKSLSVLNRKLLK